MDAFLIVNYDGLRKFERHSREFQGYRRNKRFEKSDKHTVPLHESGERASVIGSIRVHCECVDAAGGCSEAVVMWEWRKDLNEWV